MRKLVLVVAWTVLMLPVSGMAQPAPQAKPAAKDAAAKEMFVQFCASCHGSSGKGDGPAAQALKTRPSDLTMLAARNRGEFPEMRVMGAIKAGPGVPAHGSETMPVWGPMFLEVTGAASEGEVQLKIYNLMEYIKTLQAKPK